MPILRLLRCACLVVLLLACEAGRSAWALGPHGDGFVGYSQPTEFPSWGWETGVHLKILPFVGIEGNVSGFDYGAGATKPVTYAYLAGPRVSVTARRVTGFAHLLVGRAQPSGGRVAGSPPEPNGAFLFAVGGGLDVPVVSRLQWRLSGDYLRAPSVAAKHPGQGVGESGRISTGPVLRF